MAVISRSPPHGALVQQLDILDDVDNLVGAGIDGPLGEPEEHEGVVGVRAVANAQFRHDSLS